MPANSLAGVVTDNSRNIISNYGIELRVGNIQGLKKETLII